MKGGKGSSRYKGPGVETSVAHSRTSKKTREAEKSEQRRGWRTEHPKGHIRSLPVIPSVMREPWEGFESESDQL